LIRRSAIVEKAVGDASNAAAALPNGLSSGTLVRRDEPLAKHTTLRVGGAADLYVEPASEEELAALLVYCQAHGRKCLFLGRGSNLLVKDGGFRGVVVSLAQPGFSRIEVVGERLHCGAGARLKAVAVEAKRNGLAGFEFLEGIPGTVGGALRMNAGAMGGAMFDLVESVRFMGMDGIIRERTRREVPVTYRSCAMLKEHIALSVVLRGNAGSREAIEQRMNEFSRKRWESQPAAPSAGCIFKNPPSIPAGKLIDELNLKGTRIGGAVISLEHGNFIVNDGSATAKDVLELIEVIRQRVRAERGIELEIEVEIVGE
jgi:UDP-N-acetylenolpyruvoylglucosamine reductase